MTTSSNEEPEAAYEKGQIVVVFKVDVKQEQAEELINSLDLTPGKWTEMFRMLFVEVSEGKEREWVTKLNEEHSDIIVTATVSPKVDLIR